MLAASNAISVPRAMKARAKSCSLLARCVHYKKVAVRLNGHFCSS